MATIRRDTAPKKDKTGPCFTSFSSSTSLLKPTSKTNPPPITAPRKPTPTRTSLRPAISRISPGLKKPNPKLDTTTAHHKLTNVVRKTLDKTPLPTQRTRLVPATPSTRPQPPAQKKYFSSLPSIRPRDKTPLPARNTSAPRASSLSGKPGPAPQKVGLGKNPNPKPLHKDVVAGKPSWFSHATPVKTSCVCIQQEQETQRSLTATTKEQVPESKVQESVGNTDIYENLPEVETLLEGQETLTFETAEQMVTVVSGDEKGDVVGEDVVQIEAEDDHAKEDVKIVASELSPVLEQQEAPLDIKTQEPEEEKPCVEEKLEELISATKIDISNNNITTSVADELPKEEVKEKVVEEVIVIEKEKEKVVDEVAGQSEAHAPEETKVQEVVEKPKQEAENKAQKQVWPRVKKDAVSNDKIEEIVQRDQKRNRVRALAGAFESVISSQ